MPNVFRLLSIAALVAAALAGPVRADGIDCRLASTPLDKTICDTPALLAQDRALAAAFAETIAHDPAHAADLRRAESGWLKARNADCGKFSNDAARAACLAAQYAKRLAELAPPPPAPVAAAPASVAPASVVQVGPTVAVNAPASAPPDLPPPPAVALPVAAATLDATRLPAAERMETLLHVTTQGWFELSAHSATGVALQLIDMLTGPQPLAGEAGSLDGQVDVLLEQGTYKLRAFAAAGAAGEVTLAVAPFRDAAPPRTLDLRRPLDGELSSLQQLSFWFEAKAGVPIRIEAAGRALADLKLWRNGTDLLFVSPEVREIQPTRGHPLTDMVLRGTLEPGTYLVTAYGGRGRVWADGAPENPFHLRAGPSDALQAGTAGARIGPFGSELFTVPPPRASLRLDLPQPAEVQLSLLSGGTVQAAAGITRKSREPLTRLGVPAAWNQPVRWVEVAGAEGQAFTLRLEDPGNHALTAPDQFWATLQGVGFGGDEPPVTGVLLRQHTGRPNEIVGAVAPRVGPGQAWRQRFNLRGRMRLLFEVVADGPIALHRTGPDLVAQVAPVGPAVPPRADGKRPEQWDLASGWYWLELNPPQGAVGVLDLTLGPPGLLPDVPASAQPADPALPLGVVEPVPHDWLQTIVGGAMGANSGLVARPVPVDVAEFPLAVTQMPGAALEIPVRLPDEGGLTVLELGAGPADAAYAPGPPAPGFRTGTVRLPPPDHARTVVLSWRPPPQPQPPVPPPTPPTALQPLAEGTPHFLDLGHDEQKSFALRIAEGGLFRIETTGRLLTEGHVGTPFLPDLDSAAGNGIGQNFLIQRFLRAGEYRVRVATKDSAGRLGVAVRPAPIAAGATLVQGGSVRTAIAADQGVVFPIEILARGTYHLDLLSLAQGLTARLEDAEGWPLRASGDFASVDWDFAPGQYRLLVQPAGIAARVVARLLRVEPPAPHIGHGPFPLAFGTTEAATWREPPGRDDPRTPDLWSFSLAGPAAVTLTVSEGMVADLLAEGGDAPVARFASDAPYAGRLAAGAYRVRTTSLGRNDRLDYTLALASPQLQPDQPRRLTLPASEKFAIGTDRVVSLTTFGKIPLRAVLRREDGSVVERVGDRGADWNLGLSRRLPAGAYRLDLASAAPGRGEAVQPADAADTQPTDATDQPAQDQPASDTGAGPVELTLALPEERAPVAAQMDGVLDLAGGGVQHLKLPKSPPGALTVVAAAASADLVLALERRNRGDDWSTVTVARGTAPVVGGLDSAPKVGGDEGVEFRASVWTLDGGAEPIRVAARIVDFPSVAPGEVEPVKLDLAGLPQSLAVARVALKNLVPLRLADDGAGLAAVSFPFAPLAPVNGGLILPQTDQLWLLARDRPGPIALTPVSVVPGQPLALTLPPRGAAFLTAAPPANGRVRLWLAESGLGQPRVEAGNGMGVAPGSTLALACGCRPALMSDADATADGFRELPLRATALDLSELQARALDGPFAEALPPRSVLPLHLPEGVHRVHLDLAPGAAAITDWRGAHPVTVWTGQAAVSRTVEGDVADLLLVNTGAEPAPAAVTWTAGGAPALALRPGVPLKRFFGSAGSLDVPVAGGDFIKGDWSMIVVGGAATLASDTGQVQRGTRLTIFGPGRATIEHGPGLLAAWIEGDVPPWPEPAPEATSLPAHLALHDAAMTLALSPATPILLHATTTAPVIFSLGDDPPTLFPAGADVFRFLPPGPHRMKIISPDDGPLAGTLDMTGAPAAEATEGVGATVAVAPGGTAAFAFTVEHAGPVGAGIRAEPDDVSVQLLDATGKKLGEGVAQLVRLRPGRFVLEALVPPGGVPTLVRPALVGLMPRPNGPPQDVINEYLELAGRAPIPAAAKGTAP